MLSEPEKAADICVHAGNFVVCITLEGDDFAELLSVAAIDWLVDQQEGILR